MTLSKSIVKFFNKASFRGILFWVIVFIYYLSASWGYERNKLLLVQAVLCDLLLQIALARIIIDLFIPKLLNKNKKALFFVSSFLSVYMVYAFYSAFRCFYLEEVYKDYYSYATQLSFTERITSVFTFLGSFPSYISPVIVLVVFKYHKDQREIANVLEQKKSNELDALKNQLNPHFLFNTLNSLYTLALKKSDKTPEVIAKLSDILDYILFRCKSDFVPLKNEVSLLHNYISLEKVRYGKRVDITFEEDIESNLQIAPLLLLSFLENAFKHGVSQEINEAKINISIISNSEFIKFKIENSKPVNYQNRVVKDRNSIGLKNVMKQLDLLYPNNYILDINDGSIIYSVTLKVTPK